MKKLLLLLALGIAQAALSQITAVVKDKSTGAPVPYVNVFTDGTQAGVSADELGRFAIAAPQGQKLVFSAIGYETLTVDAAAVPGEVLLKPSVIELREVVVTGKREKREMCTGGFTRRDITGGYACGKVPWMIARYFPYDTAYQNTPFLKTIKIHTRSLIKDAVLNLRLYLPDSEGKPGESMYSENILVPVKKGEKITDADVSALHVAFPQEGFFVVAEWLIIDKNKYEYEYVDKESKEVVKEAMYQPSLGAVRDASGQNSWHYRGSWIRHTFYARDKNNKETDRLQLAATLILTN